MHKEDRANQVYRVLIYIRTRNPKQETNFTQRKKRTLNRKRNGAESKRIAWIYPKHRSAPGGLRHRRPPLRQPVGATLRRHLENPPPRLLRSDLAGIVLCTPSWADLFSSTSRVACPRPRTLELKESLRDTGSSLTCWTPVLLAIRATGFVAASGRRQGKIRRSIIFLVFFLFSLWRS